MKDSQNVNKTKIIKNIGKTSIVNKKGHPEG